MFNPVSWPVRGCVVRCKRTRPAVQKTGPERAVEETGVNMWILRQQPRCGDVVRESVMADDTRIRHERVFHLVVAVPNGFFDLVSIFEEN